MKDCLEGKLSSLWVIKNNVLFYKGNIYIDSTSYLIPVTIKEIHSATHEGYEKLVYRIKQVFRWKKLAQTVKDYIKSCSVCQQNKNDALNPKGLLYPLPIPNQVWEDISMDFIEGLPKSKGKTVIFVIVDRLSKYSHFSSLKHPFSALQVANVFFTNVFKLHGLPRSIVTDRDPIFVCKVWQELFRL